MTATIIPPGPGRKPTSGALVTSTQPSRAWCSVSRRPESRLSPPTSTPPSPGQTSPGNATTAPKTPNSPGASVATPRPVWNPDEKQTMNFFDQWQEIPDSQVYDNGFKIQWEHFIRHVVEDEPYRWTLPEGAKGVQLVEAALQSWKERRFVDVPPLKF